MTINVLFTGMAVADLATALDSRIEEVHGRGIETGEVEQLNEGRTRKLAVADADGNRIRLGEVSSRG